MPTSLIIPAFFAGVLTFLAPCTLPLVPGYLGFISGVKPVDSTDESQAKQIRWKVFRNGLFYVAGFSVVFILMGALLGLGGAALVQYRWWLSRIGGVFVIFFGLYLTGILQRFGFHFLEHEKRLPVMRGLKPGRPASSFVFGATFAFGWTPCIGPVLGSILTLAATTAQVGQGILLLTIFSLGLAVPFLLIALGFGSAVAFVKRIQPYLNALSITGGVLLIGLGVLLVTNQFNAWIGFFYEWTRFINYNRLLQYL